MGRAVTLTTGEIVGLIALIDSTERDISTEFDWNCERADLRRKLDAARAEIASEVIEYMIQELKDMREVAS